jgi:hypothetical protein
MKISKTHEALARLNNNLTVVVDELFKYRDMAYMLLEAESVGKMARYGKAYYKKNYLESPNKNCSDYMKSFLYLKSTEEQLFKMKDNLISKIKMLKDSDKEKNE